MADPKVHITKDANGERRIETTRSDGSKGVITTTDKKG